MTYEPQRGDYFVISSKGLIPFLIQIGTRSKDNHAGLYVGDNQVIEAMPGGVRLSPVTKYSDIIWNKHEELTEPQREAIVKEALKHLGNKYSFLDYVAIIMRIIGLPSSTWLANLLAKSSNVICSELVARVYRSVGISIEGDKPDFYITPADLSYRLLYI